jgi:molybdate transport system regulatory protein
MFSKRAGWSLTVKVWVDRDGVKVLGPGRAELLGHIERLRSISAAAKLMGMSYRRAWGLVRSMNAAAKEPLVSAAKGGPGGGGADLTAAGRSALDNYRALVARLAAAARPA